MEIAHPIMEIHAVHPHPDKQMAIIGFSDWLHIVFRLRRQLLEPGRRLEIGGMFMTLQPLKKMASQTKYKVSKSDMDFANKQCFEGRVFLGNFQVASNTRIAQDQERHDNLVCMVMP